MTKNKPQKTYTFLQFVASPLIQKGLELLAKQLSTPEAKMTRSHLLRKIVLEYLHKHLLELFEEE